MLRRGLFVLPLLLAWSDAGDAWGANPQGQVFLERWLESQNQGDFDSYKGLYADAFVGVRRSGNRTVKLDRAGWFQDRARMFQKKMTVEAKNVHVFANEKSARIVFTQHWSSGGYADVGPKQLVLRADGGDFRIVREELFTSDRKSPVFDLAAFQQFAFVVDGEIVVSLDPEAAWETGAKQSEPSKDDKILIRSKVGVDDKQLPPEIAALAGTSMRLMDAQGVRCLAKIGGFLIRSRALTTEFTEPAEAWAVGAHTLVATVDGDRKACAGATWARSPKLPLPKITPAEAADAALKQRAVAAFRALPEARSIQRQFNTWYEKNETKKKRKSLPPWFTRGNRPLDVRVIHGGPTRPTLLSVSAGIREGGCGEDGVTAELWALWQVDGTPDQPTLVLRNHPDESISLKPSAALDIDGDGQAELLFEGLNDWNATNAAGQPRFLERGIIRVLDDVYINVQGPETPILMCPC